MQELAVAFRIKCEKYIIKLISLEKTINSLNHHYNNLKKIKLRPVEPWMKLII